jgi:pantetheine-phosphate adenylyltransferase
MKAAIYPGTFDPPTLGHLDVVERGAKHFDHFVVAVGENLSKNSPFFSVEERLKFLKHTTAGIPHVEVVSFSGLLVDFAKARGISIIVRAIRTIFDFEQETLQAQINRQLTGVETFYLFVDEKCRLISSSLVREIARHGKRLTGFVPPQIEEAVFQKLKL